jgi:hypothetical protein
MNKINIILAGMTRPFQGCESFLSVTQSSRCALIAGWLASQGSQAFKVTGQAIEKISQRTHNQRLERNFAKIESRPVKPFFECKIRSAECEMASRHLPICRLVSDNVGSVTWPSGAWAGPETGAPRRDALPLSYEIRNTQHVSHHSNTPSLHRLSPDFPTRECGGI